SLIILSKVALGVHKLRSVIEDKVLEVAKKACPDRSLCPTVDTRFSELSVDSLKLIEMIYELECHFCVVADEELLAELESLGDVVSMILDACTKVETTA